MNNKNARANSEIKKRLSEIFLYDLKDPRFSQTMSSISWVKVSPDFTSCKVGVSVLDKDIEKRKEIINLLNKSSGHIKNKLVETLKLRAVPKLVFILDDGFFYAEQVNSILQDLNLPQNEINESEDNNEDNNN